MDKNTLNRNISCPGPLDISDEDVLKAMKDVQGYLDITPADAKELYRLPIGMPLNVSPIRSGQGMS